MITEARRAYNQKHYQENREAYLIKQRNYNQEHKEEIQERRYKYRQRTARLISNIKQNMGCNTCGETNPICLEFHHINPEEKEYNIATYGGAIPRLLEEMNKCIVLCRNCHSIIHSEMRNGGK